MTGPAGRVLKDFLLHTRPKAWFIVGAHFLAGSFIALSPSCWLPEGRRILSGALLWAVCLNGGTLALNSAFDRDEGDVGYLDNPPPPPRGLAAAGIGLMLAGLAGSVFLPAAFFASYLACFVLSVLYSCPPFRLKEKSGFDILINCTGYGALTIYAGWAAAGANTMYFMPAVAAGFFLLFAAFYPMTQIYQFEQDRMKKHRTFALVLGKKGALVFSLVSCIAAHGFFFAAFFKQVYQVLLVSTSMLIWIVICVHWLYTIETYPEKRGMYRALWAWALSDVSMVVAAVF